jgi:HD superfamily phosphohydrolase
MIFDENQYGNYKLPMKHFRCSIWGDIVISPLALSIIDTLEFQRLHYIRQTGFAYKVFPTATSTRFEHSVGVYHLTKWMVDIINKSLPEKERLSDFYKELVGIVGLCHDLGHGPFSHLFDEIIKEIPTKIAKEHEIRSCDIFRRMYQKYKFKELNETHVEWICRRICDPPNENWFDTLVCNPYSSFDTDKLDYLIRDARHFGIPCGFDVQRILENCRVIENKLCMCDRIYQDICKLFAMREEMHQCIYRHPTIEKFDYFVRNNLPKKQWYDIDLDSFLELYDTRVLDLFSKEERAKFETRQWDLFSKSGKTNPYKDNQMKVALENMLWFKRKEPFHFFSL